MQKPSSFEEQTIGDSNEMRAAFYCDKKQFELFLNDSQIKWRKHNEKNEKARKRVGNEEISVPLDEIIAVKVTKSLKSDNTADLKINYVQHTKSSYVLKCTAIIFSAEISVCDEWLQAIKEKQKSGFTQPKKLLIFINPISGNSKAEKIYKSEAASLFALAGVETVVIVTERAQHCKEELLTYNLSGIDGIVICGGDGMYSECINGLAERVQREAGIDVSNPDSILKSISLPVGIIPAGTGNGIASVYCGCLSVETSVLSIIMGRSVHTSVLSAFSDGKFVAFSSLLIAYGIFSNIIYETETNRQYGKLRYLLMLNNLLKTYPTAEMEISYRVDETESTRDEQMISEGQNPKGEWVTVKGTYISLSQFLIDPSWFKKRTDSNELHHFSPKRIVLQSVCSKWQMLKMMYRLSTMADNPLDFDFIKTIDTKAYKVKITPQPERPTGPIIKKGLDIDGDFFRFNGLDFEIRVHSDFVSFFSPLVPPPQ